MVSVKKDISAWSHSGKTIWRSRGRTAIHKPRREVSGDTNPVDALLGARKEYTLVVSAASCVLFGCSRLGMKGFSCHHNTHWPPMVLLPASQWIPSSTWSPAKTRSTLLPICHHLVLPHRLQSTGGHSPAPQPWCPHPNSPWSCAHFSHHSLLLNIAYGTTMHIL